MGHIVIVAALLVLLGIVSIPIFKKGEKKIKQFKEKVEKENE